MTVPILVVATIVLASAPLTFAQEARAAGPPAAEEAPPVAHPVRINSLRRASDEWEVRTRFTLTATATRHPEGMKWKFRVLNPGSRVRCLEDGVKWRGDTTANVEVVTTDALSVVCEYQPPVQRSGSDSLEFEVEELGAPGEEPETPRRLLKSAPATISVDIKPQGLRWQFLTGGTTVVEGGLSDVGSVPDLIGKTNGGDFMLNLDWVARHPQKSSDESRVGASADSHLVFRTGYVTRAEAVTATPTPEAAATSAGGAATSPPPEDAVAPRRKFTFGGEWNYNWVLTRDDSGVFAELGLLGRGAVDVDVEDKETLQQTAGRILRVRRKTEQPGTLRAEWGGRFALKQRHDEVFRTTVSRLDASVPASTAARTQTYNRNSDDLLAVEFGWLRDEALANVDTSTGVQQGRYFVRGLFTLVEIPGAPGHSKPMFGFELTGGVGQPRQVRFMYGADISAIGTLFGAGR